MNNLFVNMYKHKENKKNWKKENCLKKTVVFWLRPNNTNLREVTKQLWRDDAE